MGKRIDRRWEISCYGARDYRAYRCDESPRRRYRLHVWDWSLGQLSFNPSISTPSIPPTHPLDPSIVHTKGGGLEDQRNPDDKSWFKAQLSPPEPIILSILERRWLYEGFLQFNVIDGEYLKVEREAAAHGSFAVVDIGSYRQPGIPRKWISWSHLRTRLRRSHETYPTR